MIVYSWVEEVFCLCIVFVEVLGRMSSPSTHLYLSVAVISGNIVPLKKGENTDEFWGDRGVEITVYDIISLNITLWRKLVKMEKRR